MKKAAIYARVSSREQAEEGLSIPAQLKQLKKYAVDNGFEITHEFVDRGESARTADRPEFQKMIALAKQKPKPFDVILIHKTDRFARNREDAIIYKSLLRRECGIDVISITEKFDDTPHGQLMEGIMEVVAEFYSANLSKEVMKGMNEKADMGAVLGEPPYGYTIDKGTGKFKPYEPEAKVIRYIYNQYIEGKSLRDIGIDLRTNGPKMFGEAALKKVSKAVKNEGKYKTQKMTWRANSVRRILKNRVYIGEFSWNGKVIKNNHPAIIKREDFELVQELLKKRKKKRRQSMDYLLRGLVKCYECGGSLTQLTQRHITKNGEERIYRKLRCSDHVRLGICYPNLHKMEHVENSLFDFLGRVAQKEYDIESINIKRVKNREIIEKYNALKKKYDNFDKQFDRQMEAYQAGIIDLEQLKKYKEKLEKEKHQLEEELKIIEYKIKNDKIDAKAFYNQVKKVLETAKDESRPIEERRNALISIIDEIQISAKQDLMRVVFKF